ncbi:MAG: ATP-binding protein [Bryobacteraceae bacterium]|jgi:energy-coupling factor transporter ATP-binding protein EcfA2
MDRALPLIGRTSEFERLRTSLRKPESLLVLGPAGSGKTALVRAVLADLVNGEDIIHLKYSASLHQLLIDLARALLQAGHWGLRRLARPEDDLEDWLSHQTSVHLKGLLWTSLEAQPRTIILDGINRASFPAYRFVQRLYFAKGMAFLATARDAISLGALGRLFWDPRAIIRLQPLSHADALQVFEEAADRFHLRELEIEEFRNKVLEAAKGNPGQIVEMCRMASNPIYISGKHIKFAPLRIDAVARFLG